MVGLAKVTFFCVSSSSLSVSMSLSSSSFFEASVYKLNRHGNESQRNAYHFYTINCRYKLLRTTSDILLFGLLFCLWIHPFLWLLVFHSTKILEQHKSTSSTAYLVLLIVLSSETYLECLKY